MRTAIVTVQNSRAAPVKGFVGARVGDGTYGEVAFTAPPGRSEVRVPTSSTMLPDRREQILHYVPAAGDWWVALIGDDGSQDETKGVFGGASAPWGLVGALAAGVAGVFLWRRKGG